MQSTQLDVLAASLQPGFKVGYIRSKYTHCNPTTNQLAGTGAGTSHNLIKNPAASRRGMDSQNPHRITLTPQGARNVPVTGFN